MALNYTVKQGDCISSIAYEHGFFPDTLWNHAQNKQLKERRKDPNVLMPGDIVFVPDKRVKEVGKPTDEVHKFRVKNTPKRIQIQLKYIDSPLENTAYTLTFDGSEIDGVTDSQGWIKQSLPPNAKKAQISLGDGTTFDLHLGSLDPIEEMSGIQGRLRTLGFYDGPLSGKLDEDTTSAIKRFQAYGDLDVSGEVDEETKSQLQKLTVK